MEKNEVEDAFKEDTETPFLQKIFILDIRADKIV